MRFTLTALSFLIASASANNKQEAKYDACTLQHRHFLTMDGTPMEEALCSFGSDTPVLITGGQRHEDTQAFFLSKFDSGEFVAGASTMSVTNGAVLDKEANLLVLHQDTKLKRDVRVSNPRSNQVRATTGANKLLVVKVNTGGGATAGPVSTATLSDKWFGTSGDSINNNSQYQACSFGKISFDPYIGTTTTGVSITDGSYEITVSATYNGSDSAIESEARSVLASELGDLESQFDYVAISVPDEGQGYCAYAYINSWFSLYQGNCPVYVTVQMHEIGHNLGLAHSGEGGSTYGDTSGVMGALWDDNRNICFNGAKNGAQLGWYDDRVVDITSSGYEGLLYGIASYGDTTSSEKMLLKFTSGSTNYWISYHRAIGVNSQPGEGGNNVLVHSRSSGSGYAESTLLAKLSSGQSYNGSALTVAFTGTEGDAAFVSTSGDGGGGGSGDGCSDFEGWTDSYGDACYWYEANDSEGCPNYGGFWANPETGITPGEACCWCGGGNTSSGTATPSFSPTASPTVSSGDSCASIADKATCNKTSGCGYNAFESLCKTALTTSECSAFDGKKRKCKKNGCKWRRNTKTCKGRWD
jgi:hypothetical protein